MLDRNYSTPGERMIFARAANRPLNPSSKLHMEHLLQEDAFTLKRMAR